MNWNSTLVISYFESSRIPESTSLNILEIAAEYNNFEICEYLVKTCQFTHRISHALHTVASRGILSNDFNFQYFLKKTPFSTNRKFANC